MTDNARRQLKRCACNPLQDHLCVLDHVDSVAAAHAWRLKWNHLNEQIMDVMERDVAQAIAAHTAQAVKEQQDAYDKECEITVKLIESVRREAAQAVAERDELQDQLNYIESVCYLDGVPVTVRKLVETVAQQAEEIAQLTKAREVARVLLADDAKELAQLRAALDDMFGLVAALHASPQPWSPHEMLLLGRSLDRAREALRAPAPDEPRPEPEDRPNANGMFEPGLP